MKILGIIPLKKCFYNRLHMQSTHFYTENSSVKYTSDNQATKWNRSVPLSPITSTMTLIICSCSCLINLCPFPPLHISYFCFSSSTFHPISSHLFHFPPFHLSSFYTFFPFHQLFNQPRRYISENQTTAPQPTRERRNPLSPHSGNMSPGSRCYERFSMEGRMEKRSEWRRGSALQYQGETRWG